MLKERFKSILLIALVLLSVFFTAKIWFSNSLWPDGYQLFTGLPDFSSWFKKSSTYSIPKDSLSRPRKMVVVDNNTSIRAVFYNSDVKFNPLFAEVKKAFTTLLGNKEALRTKEQLTQKDWKQILEASAVFKSAYVSFPIAYTPKMFGQVMGVADTSALSDLSAVRDFIVLSGDGGDLSILAMDYHNHDKVMRYQIAYGETSAFAAALEAAVSGQTSPCFIAFEYGMDEPFSPTAGSERKTTIDSYVIINDSSEKQSMAPRVKSRTPTITPSQQAELIRRFGYNPQSIRRYIDSSNTAVYVENYSTLKLHPNGLVEYTALQPEKGLEILETGKNNLYESLNAAIDFTEQLWQIAMPDAPLDVCVSSNLLEEAQSNTYSFTFDYYVEGTQVIVDLPAYGVGHAVEMEMKDGKITRFCFFLREYESVPAQEEAITMLQAIDMIYEEFSASSGETVIQDIFQSFYEDGSSDQHNALWTMKVNGNYQIIKGKNAS